MQEQDAVYSVSKGMASLSVKTTLTKMLQVGVAQAAASVSHGSEAAWAGVSKVKMLVCWYLMGVLS